nr:GNAT family N-acetyltransferase [Pelagibacterium limicola]
MSDGFAAHVEAVIGSKRAKEVQRSLRRLRELGEVRFERTTDPDLVRWRVEAFLEMEHSGWKGERGTSFLSNPAHAAFAREAFGHSGAEDGYVVVDSLLLDNKPIAISINIGTGGILFTPKCAFDERYRKFGPGIVLEYLVVEAFYAQKKHTGMDAATTVDGHLISGFWNETRPHGTLIVGPSGWQTQFLARLEEIEHTLRGHAKRVLGYAKAGPLLVLLEPDRLLPLIAMW